MKKRLIIDTDLGGDCDDVGAIALANIFHNAEIIDLVCITHTTSLEWGPACIDIVNKYYNNNIEVGATKRKYYCVENTNKYAEKMANNFAHSYHNRDIVIDSIKLLRKKLVEGEKNSTTVVCIGQLNNASDLLNSEPDEISNLNGVELVKEKVKQFVVMGGLFKEENEKVEFCNSIYDREYNIVSDIESARNFIEKVPVKVIFNDFKVGYKTYTGGCLLEQKNMNHPVTFAYTLFQNKPRESWDLLTVWYAAFGNCDFFKTSEPGIVSISKDGETRFKNDIEGNHYIIRFNNSNDYIEEKIDNILSKGDLIYEKI